MKHLAFALALAALLSTGCGMGRQVQRGANRYQQADYVGAMSQWRYVEDREEEMNDKGRVRYLVYRGLTHYRLFQQTHHPGHHALALHYLARGKLAYDSGTARWLQAKTVVEMKDALAELTGQVPAASTVLVVQLPAQPEAVIVPSVQQPAPAPDEDDEDTGW